MQVALQLRVVAVTDTPQRIEKYYPIMFASNRTEAKQIMSRINEKEHGEKA